jgi:hypothetical protein
VAYTKDETLILSTFYESENWTLTASQRRRIEAAEVKLLRPLTGCTLCDHKTNNSIRQELRIKKQASQDRRMQKEKAFTHTKNATKPNISKIIQLQATRKKINWTT